MNESDKRDDPPWAGSRMPETSKPSARLTLGNLPASDEKSRGPVPHTQPHAAASPPRVQMPAALPLSTPTPMLRQARLPTGEMAQQALRRPRHRWQALVILITVAALTFAALLLRRSVSNKNEQANQVQVTPAPEPAPAPSPAPPVVTVPAEKPPTEALPSQPAAPPVVPPVAAPAAKPTAKPAVQAAAKKATQDRRPRATPPIRKPPSPSKKPPASEDDDLQRALERAREIGAQSGD